MGGFGEGYTRPIEMLANRSPKSWAAELIGEGVVVMVVVKMANGGNASVYVANTICSRRLLTFNPVCVE